MDNLTHSLIGAALGQAGLKRKTGLAIPALIIAANLPDIDAGCAIYGIESLAMRRGLTHGPIAMVLLPLLLAGALWWFDRWQDRRGKRPVGRMPLHFGWLLALCMIGTLSHPAFDWFNNYGIRLLEPFSSQWFYGDTLFIIDPWIIAMLGAGIWFSLRRERGHLPAGPKPVRIAIGATTGYIALNWLISGLAVAGIYDGPSTKVVSAVPGTFWRREVLWRDDGRTKIARPPESFGRWQFSIIGDWQPNQMENLGSTNMSDPRIAEWSKNDPAAQAFLFWARMPIAELHDDRIILRDLRFMNPLTADQFSVTLRPTP